MKNIRYLIIVSLLELSLSALNCAEQHETNHAKAARLALAKINAAEHSATGLSWEDIDRLKMMPGQHERVEQLAIAKINAAEHSATGLSWEDIDRLKMIPDQHN